MSNTNNSPNPEERWRIWLSQAKYDLAAAFLSLENEYFEWATYQAAQAVEKALKSVLVKYGGKAPKIHKLGILFGYCNQVNDEFRNTKFNFKRIESFTFISRYPFLMPDKTRTPHELITERDANSALFEASEAIIKISRILKVPQGKTRVEIKEDLFTHEQIVSRCKEIEKQLVSAFNPEKIILFGSFARKWGEACKGTMDVLVIAPDKGGSFFERIYTARDATRGSMPIIEPLVYTPDEIKLLRQEDEAFLKSAFDEGKIIYSKNAE